MVKRPSRWYEQLDRTIARLAGFTDMLAGMAMLCLTVVVFWGVLARYGFGRPLQWSPPISMALMVPVVFLPLGGALVADAHVRSEAIRHLLPGRSLRIMDSIALFLASLASILVFAAMTERFRAVLESGSLFPGGGFALWIPTVSAVLGAGVLVASLIGKLALVAIANVPWGLGVGRDEMEHL